MAIRRALPDLSAAGFGGKGIPRLLWLSSTVPKKTLRETAQLQRIIIAIYILCSNKPISSIKPKSLGLGMRYTQEHHSPLQSQQGGVTLPCSTTLRHPSLHTKAVWNGVKNWCKEVVFSVQHGLCVGRSNNNNNVILDLHADGGLVLFGFAFSIPPAHSQGEDYSENSSSNSQAFLFNNCKISPGFLGYFGLNAYGSHRPYNTPQGSWTKKPNVSLVFGNLERKILPLL